MTVTNTTYQKYMFGAADDGERRTFQHNLFKADFVKRIEYLLKEYGLETKLETALANGKKLRILDLGCAEGLFLHDMAEVLEKKGLLKAAELIGIDRDVDMINLAEQLSTLSTPPRPYLNFYVHDVTEPLESSIELRYKGVAKFDFIFALSLVQHLPNARQHLEAIYRTLKPGGVLYLRDAVMEEGENGWISSHPILRPFGFALNSFVRSLNDGLDVSVEEANWLREIGAEQVQTIPVKYVIGGNTPHGMQMLRNSVMLVRNSGAALIAQGKFTPAQFDGIMNTLFKELTPESAGQQTWLETLARKAD